ncbi:MAG: NADH-quinone oxidoreductase subunit NuoH [Thermoplasmata archaeon]|nr:NADH-quinone oxidoreductase subunit NuoH [Thermoplasmata archaeon]
MSSWINLYNISYAIGEFLMGIVAAILNFFGQWIGPLSDFADWLMSVNVLNLVAIFIGGAAVMVFVSIINLFIIMWIERKMYGRIHDRRGIMLPGPWKKTHKGTGFLQNLADGMKLIQKELITPKNADKWMYDIAPAIIATTSILAFVAIPFSETFYVANINAGLIFILAILAIAPLAVVLAGWSSNNKFTLIGGLRGAALMLSYEIPLILSVIGVILLSGSLNPIEIVHAQQQTSVLGVENWYIIPLFPAVIVFMVALFAELERLPFDLPEAEAELVEGWLTEYSGMRFGLVFVSKWVRTYAGAALITILFLGGWSGPVLPGELWFIIKSYIVFVIIVWATWSFPRSRIDQIVRIGWNWLIPIAIISIVIAAAFKWVGWF